ncbi:DUF397 domain-containing protein [Crossiella sp. SN42]|uniref:DUF397 domain-containing protein n=1 Tax=Crossiella sp. SN42 TaxID=2944808 RepID=UPI00207C44B0|nr:DUF397 domain-containing protein [Crossiella sp. SN42]MCO1575370.1 DUF397 domain-containing protein [Crossiella sp. SN42]
MSTFDPSSLEFRRSSRCHDGRRCVEVAVTPNWVAVRDSKNRDAGCLVVSADAWHRFLPMIIPE